MLTAPTFSNYVARKYLFWCASVTLVLAAIVLLLDFVELLRRMAGREGASFGLVLSMALFKLPNMVQKIVPFAVLFGSMLAFWRLNRNHELVVARAAGVSVWQFLMPVLIVAALIGTFKITLFNPFSAATLRHYEQLEARYIKGRSSLAAVSGDGMWLRQTVDGGNYVIHAQELSPRQMELRRVIVFLFEGTDKFVGRVDAPVAHLQKGYWVLEDARITTPQGPARPAPLYRIETEITPENIYDSFAPPETLSFWSLPRFIGVLEKAGFSGLRHRLYWNTQLAEPFLLCAMVLVAAAFSLRPIRSGGAGVLIAAGVGAGLLLYFLSDVVFALGVSARIPIILAAWSPATVTSLLGAAMLFHLEDG